MQDKDQSTESKSILAIDLFNQALTEEDPEKRFFHIKNACKIITMTLPYKKRIIEFKQYKDLFFYLMVLEIFNKKAISLMVNTFLDKLGDLPDFLPLFSHAFLEMAECPESQLQKEGREVRLEIPPFLIKYVDPNYKRNLNRDILKYMNYIKEIAVEYLRKFTLEKFATIMEYSPSTDILKIIIAFINNTHVEGLTRKICNVLRDILSHEQASALIKDEKLARDILQAVNTSENNVRRMLAASQRKDSAKKSFKLGLGKRKTVVFEADTSPSGDNIVEGGIKEEEDDSDDSFIDETQIATEAEREYARVQEVFEKWLMDSEKHSMMENEDVLHFFRDQKNAQLFLNMIFEPSEVNCSDAYYDYFEDMANRIKQLPFQLIGYNFKSFRMNDTGSLEKESNVDKFETLRAFRAYKCCQILFDEYNWAQITLAVPQFISEFFSRFEQAIHLPSPKINLVLMTRIFDLFIRRDPEQMLMNLIQYNLPFVLLWNLEFNCVRDLLMNIVNLSLNYYRLSQAHLAKLSVYFKHTDFFIDYLNLILDKNRQPSLKKMAVSYKPKELIPMQEKYNEAVNNMLIKASRNKKLPPTCAVGPARRREKEYRPFQLPEERDQIFVDIDRVMENVKEEPVITDEIKNKEEVPKRASMFRSSSIQLFSPLKDQDLDKPVSTASIAKSNKMYPSLLEAIKKEEEARIKERESVTSTPRTFRGLTPRGYKNSSPSLTRLSAGGARSSARESPTPRNLSSSPEKDIKPQSNTTIAEEGSPVKQRLSAKNTDQRNNVSPFSKKGRDSPTSQFNLDMLKSVHPDVKLHIFISHFQNVNAPLTQAVLNADALPSKMLGRTASLPQLSKVVKESSVIGVMGQFVHENTLSPTAAKNNEGQAYPLAVTLEEMVELYFTNYKQTNLMKKIGIESTADLEVIQCLQGVKGATFFNLLLRNYLFKTSCSIGQDESSSVICGKIINTILAHLNEHPDLQELADEIHEESCKGVPYLAKLIADSCSWKKSKPRVYLQNYMLNEVFGSHRLLLLTTLLHIIQNDQKHDYSILSKIPEVFWFVFGYWFVELKHQNIFQNIAMKIYKIAFKFGSEDVVIKALIKGNILSHLQTAYNDVSQNNEQTAKMLHAENFVRSVKDFVYELSQVQKTRGDCYKLTTFLSQLTSWKSLKKAFLPPEDSGLNSTSSTLTLFKKEKTQTFNNERRKKLPTLGPESLVTNRDSKPITGSNTEREAPKASILKRLNERRESTERSGSVSKLAGTERERSSVLFVSDGKEIKSKNEDISKTIILPAVMKANKNHVRSQTTLKVRGGPRVK